MPEFLIVKRTDIPRATKGPHAASVVSARLHKSGNLYLSVSAIRVLGSQNCQVMAEFAEEERILKITAVDHPPKGIEEAALFPVRAYVTKRNRNPMGMLYIGGLLRLIGCPLKRPLELPVAAVDAQNRSISLVLPCDGSSC